MQKLISFFCYSSEPFQYEVVAVVANDASINSIHDLRGSRFCHPGHGLSRHWTDILANVNKKKRTFILSYLTGNLEVSIALQFVCFLISLIILKQQRNLHLNDNLSHVILVLFILLLFAFSISNQLWWLVNAKTTYRQPSRELRHHRNSWGQAANQAHGYLIHYKMLS